MCRLGLMSGGLGDRDDDFVRRSTRPRRGEDFIRSSTRRQGARHNRAYDSGGEEYESDASVYDRRPRYRDEEPVARDASALWRRCLGVDALDATRCGHGVVPETFQWVKYEPWLV